MKTARLVIAALLAGLFAAGSACARPPVWVVRDADSEVVIRSIRGSGYVLVPPGE